MVRCTNCRSANFDKRLPRLPSGALGSSTCPLFSTCVSLFVPIDSPAAHPSLSDEKHGSRYGACDDGGRSGGAKG
jgi:hypothetical protein